MAERRMFAKQITESDAFLEMPVSSQCLYFHLGMNADDDGFVNSPKRIVRMIGASEDDMKLLIAKNFVILFDTGVIVIKHWRLNNQIRADRRKPTDYQDELAKLYIKRTGIYTLTADGNQLATNCQPSDNQLSTNCLPSIGKYRRDKKSIDKGSIEGKTYDDSNNPELDRERLNELLKRRNICSES